MEPIIDPTFERWLAHHAKVGPAKDDEMWLVFDGEESSMNPATLAVYLARLFAAPAQSLAPYDDDTAAEILRGIVGGTGACLYDALSECEDRAVVSVIEAIPCLFRDFIAPRCRPSLSESDGLDSKLEETAYMFYDSWLLSGVEPGHDLYHECAAQPLLRALRETLEIDHEMCQYAALHGLGHVRRVGYASEIEAMIDSYLTLHPASCLREYALQARRGEVL